MEGQEQTETPERHTVVTDPRGGVPHMAAQGGLCREDEMSAKAWKYHVAYGALQKLSGFGNT